MDPAFKKEVLDNGITIIDLSGRLKDPLGGSSMLRDAVLNEIKENAARSQNTKTSVLILNMANVTYMDEVAVGELVRVYAKARDKGIALAVCDAPLNVRGVLDYTNALPLFSSAGTLFDNRETAIGKFSSHRPSAPASVESTAHHTL